jgi:hypothetical protein
MMSLEERCRRAAERVAVERVRPILLHDGSYLVASSNAPGRGYRVHVDPEGALISCDCPAGSWDLPCKHAQAVLLLRERLASGEVMLAPAC